MRLFELFATLGLDTSSFDKGISNSKSSMTSFANSYTSGFEKAAGQVVKYGAIAGAAVTALGAMGVNYNTQMETYTTNFEVMLGSSEAAVKKIEEIKKFSQKTPFELSDLTNATETLLAFNVEADESTQVLQMLGDISLGNSQKLETLTRAYGKMNSSQKVNLESINMMIDAGYNPLLQIQEDLGVSMEEVYSMISNGEISFKQLESAMQSATSEGGQFHNGMEKASTTTAGLISTLKDLVNSKAGEFFQGVSDKIKEFLPYAIEFVENLDVEEVMQGFADFYADLEPWLPLLAGLAGAATGLYVALKLLLIVETVKNAINAFKLANDAATVSQALLNAVMNLNPFILVATLVAGLVSALIVLWNTNEDFRNAVMNIWNSIKDIFGNVGQFILDTFNNIKDFFTNLPTNVWNAIKGIMDFGKDIVQGFWNGIEAMGDWLWGKVGDFFGGIGDFVKGIFGIASPSKLFKYYGKMIDEGFVDGILGGARNIENAMDDTFNNFDNPSSPYGYTSNNSGGNSITINVDGSGDPEAVAQEVNRLLGGYV